VRQLNSGHTIQGYFISQLHRMRKAFFLCGRDLLPNLGVCDCKNGVSVKEAHKK
jgi:hypothetical protein